MSLKSNSIFILLRQGVEMTVFSDDTDILRYEPSLFGVLHLPWQGLAVGSGAVVSGTTLTDAGANFTAPIAAGCVIWLRSSDGSLEGYYEIVSVESSTVLNISVLRASSDDDAIAPLAASSVGYRICTFAPQGREVGITLTGYFGIKPGDPASEYDVDDIVDKTVLRQASVFGVISSVYAMLASSEKDENFWAKSLYYQKLFDKARRRCRVSIDTGSDGIADVTATGASVRLMRD